MTEAQLDEVITKLDTDGDGEVDLSYVTLNTEYVVSVNLRSR